jgi:poly(A) polymerase
VLKRCGYDEAFVERVALLVARHMIRLPADTVQASRFVRRQRTLMPDLLEVMLADREAARGASSSAEARHAYQVGFDRVLEAMKQHDAVKPLLSGEDVMALLKLEPGREVGKALEFVQTLQDAGDVATADEARAALLEWARVRGSL